MLSALFLLLSAAQAPAPKPPAPQPPAASSTAASTVQLADGHMQYTLPTGVKQQQGMGESILKEETAKQGNSPVAKAAASCVSLPVLAMDDSTNFRMVVIMRLDFKCMGTDVGKVPLDALATSSLQESLARMGGSGKVSPTQSYKLGGHDAVAVRGTEVSEKLGVTFQAVVACTAAQQDALCWEFMTLTPEAMEALISQPVKVDDGAPVPVLPKDVFSGLKVSDSVSK